MTELSLKERLARWFKANPGWHPSGDIQRMVMQKTTYTAQNVGRRLRELQTEEKLEVRYEKNHAYYRTRQTLTQEEFWNLPSAVREPSGEVGVPVE